MSTLLVAQSCSLLVHLELPLILADYLDISGADSVIVTLNTQRELPEML